MPEQKENTIPPLVRISDEEALAMVRVLAEEDMRSIGMQVAWLIRQEYARRFSQPNPLISVEQAQSALQNQAA